MTERRTLWTSVATDRTPLPEIPEHRRAEIEAAVERKAKDIANAIESVTGRPHIPLKRWEWPID